MYLLYFAIFTIGVGEPLPGVKTIDNFTPSNKEEFVEFANLVVKKFSSLEVSFTFFLFCQASFQKSWVFACILLF